MSSRGALKTADLKSGGSCYAFQASPPNAPAGNKARALGREVHPEQN
jgi:hypothetical protein